jgi:DNA gyrase subunit A
MNLLFKYTPLQGTFSIIMLALADGEPRVMSLKALLRAFIEHRLEVIRRRSEYDLARAEERAHILEGLITAIDNIDQCIEIIRKSRTTETAQASLMKTFKLSEVQAIAILDMQLRRLAALERKKLDDELKEKQRLIKDLKMLLSSEKLMRMEVSRETKLIRDNYADQRRTVISRGGKTDVTEAGLVSEQDDTWVTLTIDGKMSRPFDEEPPKVAASMKDPPLRVLQSNTSDTLYVVTEQGMCATMLTSQLPRAHEVEEGLPFWELCDLSQSEAIANVVSLPPQLEQGYLFFVSEQGEVKRLSLEDLPGMRAQSFKIFDVEEGDRLRWVFIVADGENAVLVTRNGQAIQFTVDEVRPSGLTAGGMRGIKLGDEEDRVVGAGVVGKFTHVWVCTEGGIGKRSSIDDYPTQGRAGQGVRSFRFPPGDDQALAAALVGQLDNEMVVLTNKGKAKRNRITNAPSTKRDYKGDSIVSLAKDEFVVEAFQFEPRLEVEVEGE